MPFFTHSSLLPWPPLFTSRISSLSPAVSGLFHFCMGPEFHGEMLFLCSPFCPYSHMAWPIGARKRGADQSRESLTVSALSPVFGMGKRVLLIHNTVRGEKGGKKFPRAGAQLLTNMPQVGEHGWNYPLWCFHMRVLRSCWLRSALMWSSDFCGFGGLRVEGRQFVGEK